MARIKSNNGKSRFWLYVMLVGLLALAGVVAWLVWPYIEGDMEYARVREVAAEPVEDIEAPADAGDPLMHREIDWDALRAINPDVIGWIYCPNTPIDYPVVQDPPSDPGKYLHTTFEGKVSWPNNEGTIYLDCDNIEDGFLSEAPLLYGHYQNNQSMFSAWSHNWEQGRMDDKCHVYIYTPEGTVHVELFAANKVNAATESIRVDFADKADLNAWLDTKLSESENVRSDPGEVDQLWTFCVCSYGTWKNQRTLSYGNVVESTLPEQPEEIWVEEPLDANASNVADGADGSTVHSIDAASDMSVEETEDGHDR